MTGSRLQKIMISILFTYLFVLSSFSQTNSDYSEVRKYRKLGFIIGPILYNRAELDPQYGDYTFENKPIIGFNAGFEYNFNPEKEWSIITGFIVALEPIYKMRVKIKDEDVYSYFEEEVLTLYDKSNAMTSFSVPILLRLNLQIKKRVFLNFRTGLKAMYFPDGSASLSWTFHNEDDTESREVFGLRVDSPNNSFQGSFVIGSDISYTTKKTTTPSKSGLCNELSKCNKRGIFV